jgi:hypothetical protein
MRLSLKFLSLFSWLVLGLGCAERHGAAGDAGPRDAGRDGYDWWYDEEGCFAAGTRIDTPGGPVPIEAAFVGMPVFAFDVARSERTVRHVTAVHVHQRTPVGLLTLSDGTALRVTANHPIYSPSDDRYRPAGALGAHDQVLSMHAGGAGVGEIAAYEADVAVDTVYNISVSGEHNYFAEGVLVHNKSPPYEPCQPSEAEYGFVDVNTALWQCQNYYYYYECTVCVEAVDSEGDPCLWLSFPGSWCECPVPEGSCLADGGVGDDGMDGGDADGGTEAPAL